jgi:hypothetical protein
MRTVISVVLSLLPLLLLVAAVVWFVRMSRRGADVDRRNWSLRRLVQYSFLLGALFAAANGVALLVQSALPSGDRLAGTPADELALGLSLTIVALPAWALLWRLVHDRLAEDPAERTSPAWTLYLAVATTVPLIVMFVNAVLVGTWLLGVEDFSDQAVAGAVVWGLVWAGHLWLLHRPHLAPPEAMASLVLLAGSAVGVVGLAVGAWGVLRYAFGEIHHALSGGALAEVATTEMLRRNLVVVGVAVGVWWWYWLRRAVRGPVDTAWHVYVMLVPVLGGLVSAVTSAALSLHAVLQWYLGVPDAVSAAAQFEVLPGAFAGLVVGGAAWAYHRAVLGEVAGLRRTEPGRAYEHVAAAVGLLAAASGATVAIMAAIQAVAPTPVASTDPQGRNALVVAVTLLVVGAPLWGVFWSRLERRAAAVEVAEIASPSRRAYLFLVLVAAGATTAISLVVVLYTVFRDLIEATLAPVVFYELRAAVALAATAGAVAAYHWTVHRSDRGRLPVKEKFETRTVVLVSPDGNGLAAEVSARTGARVRTLHRLDTPGAAAVDVDALVEAITAAPQGKVLVVLDAAGAVRVIPYEVD